MNRLNALLLIGPTGSGKTPLGRYLEQNGLGGRKCFHFDFGESLRRITYSGWVPEALTERDVQIIYQSLKSGALLEKETFYIAETIFHAFVNEAGVRNEDALVLNGLPRHREQAEDMAGLVSIDTVLHLKCTPETVLKRIEGNAGGDRLQRGDDSLEAVAKKLEIFKARTLPLLSFYTEKGIPVVEYSVDTQTGPEQIWDFLNKL
jgi:adenylate kinase family enzyme